MFGHLIRPEGISYTVNTRIYLLLREKKLEEQLLYASIFDKTFIDPLHEHHFLLLLLGDLFCKTFRLTKHGSIVQFLV